MVHVRNQLKTFVHVLESIFNFSCHLYVVWCVAVLPVVGIMAAICCQYFVFVLKVMLKDCSVFTIVLCFLGKPFLNPQTKRVVVVSQKLFDRGNFSIAETF